MDDNMDYPEESRRHVQALLSRHPPQVIQRMFQQEMDSSRNSTTSTFSIISSNSSSTSSSNWSFRSRLSDASTFSTYTSSSDMAPSIVSSSSQRSTRLWPGPRTYPAGVDPTRPKPLAPVSDISSPLDTKYEPSFTPTDEEMGMNLPIVFPGEGGQSQPGESFLFCTYCAEVKVLKTFKAKSDWKKHEMRMHETGEDWPCPVNGCNRILDRQKDFVKHHQRYHSGRELPSINDIGIRLLPRRVFGCGFDRCKEVSLGWDERCDHVAKHIRNGASFEQWKYSNLIRNLIRQEALHDTWKELVNCLDERLRETLSQISWCHDNSRILRQKLQCCDLRPSREEVLITALSLRADIPLDASYQDLPPGFVTPSRDSVPNVDILSREQRMQILIGNSNVSLSRTRLATINAALLQASNTVPKATNYEDCGGAPFDDSPTVDISTRRISYMDIDLDTGLEFPDVPQLTIPDLSPNLDPHQNPMIEGEHGQNPGYVYPAMPSNPLGWDYPNYFDPPPIFEESVSHSRPPQGQMTSIPLRKIRRRFSRHNSSHSPPTSQVGQEDMDFPIKHPNQVGISQAVEGNDTVMKPLLANGGTDMSPKDNLVSDPPGFHLPRRKRPQHMLFSEEEQVSDSDSVGNPPGEAPKVSPYAWWGGQERKEIEHSAAMSLIRPIRKSSGGQVPIQEGDRHTAEGLSIDPLPELRRELSSTAWKEIIKALPKSLQPNIEYCQSYGDNFCWTCTPDESVSPDAVPLTIAGAPVVIPVKYTVPVLTAATSTPDPVPDPISPWKSLSQAVIQAIYKQFCDATGFYLLLNGLLQILVPPDFDYEWAYSHQPTTFGGLKVCYVEESKGIFPTMLADESVRGVVPNWPLAQELQRSSPFRFGSVAKAKARDSGKCLEYTGKIGLKTRYNGKLFLTISSHVIAKALAEMKTSLSVASATPSVDVFTADGSTKLGVLAETFDPDACEFPFGYQHDLSLVEASDPATVSEFTAPINLGWLSKEGWMKLKFNTTRLFFLEDAAPPEQDKVKSICLQSSQYQIVGQGILFNKPKPSKLRSAFRRSDGGVKELGNWKSLVARSLLYRISPDQVTPGGQSGIALCVNEKQEDGGFLPRVAGFQSFVQGSGWVQDYDMEGEDLYSRLQKGRIAFYGAFQIPEKIRENFDIC